MSLVSEDDDFVPISALQHLIYCERQAALIHVERVWDDDASTVAGTMMHERADSPGADFRRGARVERAVVLRSERLRLWGRADTVEYVSGPGGRLEPFPVEYKVGRRKSERADRVQLCAQALCLSEMHGCRVPAGGLFYAASHKRVEVEFTEDLVAATEAAAWRLREIVRTRVLPRVPQGPKCKRCSLAGLCLPAATSEPDRALRYLDNLLSPRRAP
jgi:CRISPR-associated exonuclease Cas4